MLDDVRIKKEMISVFIFKIVRIKNRPKK